MKTSDDLKENYTKLNNKYIKLKQQLEEKDNEIERIKVIAKENIDKVFNAECENTMLKTNINKNTIEELEKVKHYWDLYKNTKFTNGCLFDNFLEQRIKELKGGK